MTTITWRVKITFLAGATLIATGLLLTFTGPGASGLVTPDPVAAPAPAAGQAPATRPGDNGTVKIHRATTPVADRRNQPHVCNFYLDAFGFDAAQGVTWKIESWPPTGDRAVVTAGVLTLDGNGDGYTGDMTLPAGHYKLFWNFTGENGFAKQKVFWVSCGTPTAPSAGTPSPSVAASPSLSPSPSGSPGPSPSGSPGPSPSGSRSASVAPTSTATPMGVATSASFPAAPNQGGLPITGWPLALIAGTGVTLVGTGGTAIVLTRRRRGLHSSR